MATKINMTHTLNLENQVVIKGINRKTTWFIVGTQTIMMIWSLGSAILKSGQVTAAIITYLCFFAFLAYAVIAKSRLVSLLLVFGLAGGILELFADNYSVVTINALNYPDTGIKVASSPLYMPFAWANVFVQLGYYSLLLVRWKGLFVASIIMAFAGGLYIPFYESFAKNAEWWWYENVSMIWDTPYYIIICEMLISLVLPLCIYLMVKRKDFILAIVLGVLEGLWIWGSAILAYAIAP